MSRTSTSRSRRAEILAASESEFGVFGYSGARMNRIAAAAGVNKQLLFHYFASKEGLFNAAVSSIVNRLESSPPTNGSPPERLRLIIERSAEGLAGFPGLVGIVAEHSSGAGSLPATAIHRVSKWRERALEQLASTVQDGQRRGYFRDDLDPAVVARVALAATLGMVALGPGRGGGLFPKAQDESPVAPLSRFLAECCAWR
ncbi:MAG: TetR/AcrR family transcriptional regulator [Gemmatimonadetes bacterium]|nr:TetR/AcrR family transcriptional regulator [Gemmatimonadota bacterium]